MSPENRSNEDEAMRAEAESWLQLCGCCDAGILGASCVCPPGEPRNVIGWALQRLAAVERERDAYKRSATAAWEAHGGVAEMYAEAEAELDAALARIAAVEAAEAEIRAEASEREPEWHSPAIVEDARALALRWACKTIRAVLAASPTPTGPEPKRRVVHSIWGQDPSGYCGCLDCNAPDDGPATPEPTEETPPTRWMPAPDTTWVNGVPSDVIQVGPGGADPKETRE